MKRWQLIAIGGITYVLAILVTAPATLLDAGLQRVSQGKLGLVEAQGTMWAGAGQIEIRDADRHSGVTEGISWRLMPGSLLRGYMMYDLQLAQSPQSFPIMVSLGGMEIANAEINLPAAVLGLSIPKLSPLGLSGDLSARIAHFKITHQQMQGQMKVQWHDAGSVLTRISPLGNYELSLDGAGTLLNLQLRTLHGPLQLDGAGAWTYGDRAHFRATALVAPAQQQQLDPLLRLIGMELSHGRFELQFK